MKIYKNTIDASPKNCIAFFQFGYTCLYLIELKNGNRPILDIRLFIPEKTRSGYKRKGFYLRIFRFKTNNNVC